MHATKHHFRRIALIACFGIALGVVLFGGTAYALDTGVQYGTATGLGTQDLRVSIMNVIRIFLGFLGILALVIILYGGYVWMTSGGNAERVDTAKRILTNAVIGLVIILSAFMIVSFIINQLIDATGAGPGLPACTAGNVGEVNGCYVCSDMGGGTYSWQVDFGIPGCDPTTVRECRVVNITPQGTNRPMNSIVRVRFNHPGVTNEDDVTVTGPAGPVPGTFTVTGGLVEFTPSADCAAPWQDKKCFDANTTYQIQVNTGSIQCGGFDLVCGTGLGADPCLATFTTGDFVDTAVPTVQLIGSQICQAATNQLSALVDDDYGIAYVSFVDTITLNASDDTVTVPPPEYATVNWNTTTYGLTTVSVTATAVDYDSNQAQDTQSFPIQGAHCCNLVQDQDETGVDCGGTDCEPCVPVIEWVSPLDGAPGNLVTIHGRRFGTAAGTVTFLGDPTVPTDDVVALNPSTVNSLCTDYWNNQEIIIVVPAAAVDGPIQVTRADNQSDRTDQAPGTNIRNFDINTTDRPGLCAILPLTCEGGTNNGQRCQNNGDCPGGACSGPPAGQTSDPETLAGINFNPTANQNNVFFGATLAGGTVQLTGTNLIAGITVPAMKNSTVGVRSQDNVSRQYSNPLSFVVGTIGGGGAYDCTTDANRLTCSPDQSACDPDEYCNSQCKCEARIVCDTDNFQTPTCEPNQGLCPPGWFCYNPAVHAPDPTRDSCYCYQAASCDNPTQPPSTVNPSCNADGTLCPNGYVCDPVSNCTCQTQAGISDASTYTWFFSTTSFGPRVVETCNRNSSCQIGAISSPTPFSRLGTMQAGYRVGLARPDDGAVPIDAIPGAMFTTKMYEPSLTNATIQVFACNSAGGDFNATTCVTSVAGSLAIFDCNYQDPLQADATCFEFDPNALLAKNTWYQLVLDSNIIFGQNGVPLAGNSSDGNYRWVFKTRDSDELSQVACVYVQPAGDLSYYYGEEKKWRAQATPQDFVCVVMDPNSCSWDWRTNEVLPERAEITDQSLNNATTTSYIQTVPNPPVDVVAACTVLDGFKEGQGELTIDFTSPRIIERFPDCGTACLNARIGAMFSRPMNDASVIGALELYICYDNPNCEASPANVVTTFLPPTGEDPAEPNTYIGDTECFDANGDGNLDYCLLPNTYYRVVVRNTAVSRDENKPLVGLNYDDPTFNGLTGDDSHSWIFKTQKDFGLCLPGVINVIPSDKISPVNRTILYTSQPKTAPDSCNVDGQRLNPFIYDWGWDPNLVSKQYDNPFCSGGDIADFLTTNADGYCPIPHPGQLRDACGNGVINWGEDCDDGNIVSGDGCSGTDVPGTCLTESDPDTGNSNIGDVCGNGVLERSEECDTPGVNGCSFNCLYDGPVANQSLCGDGQIGLGEECDQGELAVGGTPAAGDGCTARCLIEDRSQGYCRSLATNSFDFKSGQCFGFADCNPGFVCIGLNTVNGNTNSGPVCGNGLIETGEECDIGGTCSDNAEFCTTSNLSNCANPITATCQPQNASGCSAACINTGSVRENDDPPNVGAHQLLMTLADGEIYVQSWLTNYLPTNAGPLGEGHLFVGNGGLDGPTVIDRWPDCGTACINAALGAQFSMSMDVVTLSPANIILYECRADSSCDLATATQITPILIQPFQTNGTNPNDSINVVLPPTYNSQRVCVGGDNAGAVCTTSASCGAGGTCAGRRSTLLPNTFYRVVIRNNVTSGDGKVLVGLNYDDPTWNGEAGRDAYSWIFKTQASNDLCTIGRIDVLPSRVVLPPDVKQRYFSQPWSDPDSCDPLQGQRLNPYFYDWSWDDVELDTSNVADFLQPFRDGCGNGVLDWGEDCDDENIVSGDGCSGTNPGAWLPGITGACLNEQDTDTGNSNHFDVCGNGIVEPSEACDTGSEPNGNDSDGCTDICTISGAVGSVGAATGSIPGVDAVCGDGRIDQGEECDDSQLTRYYCLANLAPCDPTDPNRCGGDTASCVNVPKSGDGCTGYYADDSTGTAREDCLNIDFGNDANNHQPWCYWTGAACRTRGCLIENRGEYVCRSNGTGRVDYRQGHSTTASGITCRTGFTKIQLSQVTGNNNWGQSVCGNLSIETGEECDWGDDNSLFGCTDQCLNAGSVVDGLIDPFQVVMTSMPNPPSTLHQVREEVRAWQSTQPETVGKAELAVEQGANIPFSIIGHYPAIGADNQCRNVAMYATFSKPLNQATLFGDGKYDNIFISTNGATFTEATTLAGLPAGFAPTVGYTTSFGTSQVVVWSGSTAYVTTDLQNFVPYSPTGLPVKFTPTVGYYTPQGGGKVVLWQGAITYASTNGTSFSEVGPDDLEAAGFPEGFSPTVGYYTVEPSSRTVLWSGSVVYESSDGINFAVQTAPAGLPAGFRPNIGYYHGFSGGYTVLWNRDTLYLSPDGTTFVIGDPASAGLPPGFIPRVGVGVPMAVAGGGVVLTGDGNKNNVRLCEGTCAGSSQNLIKGFSYRPVQGACVSNQCQFPYADVTSFGSCQTSADCQGGQISITSVNTPTGFLDANRTYQIEVVTGPNGVLSAVDDALAPNPCTTSGDYTCTSWSFSTNADFCSCDYIGVKIAYTSSGNETRNDLFTCATDSCGQNTPFVPSDDDAADGTPATEATLAGNQHLYEATCYDINNPQNARIQVNQNGIRFNWLALTPDQLIYLTDPVPGDTYNNQTYVTPNDKNGDSEVRASGYQYACTDSGQLCNPASPVNCGAGAVCRSRLASTQYISVTNFICENPWPGYPNLFYDDNGNNGSGAPDTNFKLFYCRDNGKSGTADDLPALSFPGTTVIGGANVLKDILLPTQVSGSADAIGVRVLKNPLHLSPATWYKSGLCGGQASLENICFADVDCSDTNVFTNGGFEQQGSAWITQSESGSVSVSYLSAAAYSSSLGARLTASGIGSGGWAQLVNGPDISLPSGSYTYSAYIKSNQQVKISAQVRGTWVDLCVNPDCGLTAGSPGRCSVANNEWQKVSCSFYVANTSNVQFYARLTSNGSADIDGLQVVGQCAMNLPTKGNVQTAQQKDGYRAVRDGRSLYVSAANTAVQPTSPSAPRIPNFSNIYLISYSKDASAGMQEIFKRIIDPEEKKGSWSFNADITDHQICNQYGYFKDTTIICDNIGDSFIEDCLTHVDEQGCNGDATAKGCYWNQDARICQAHSCEPIYCQNNFECPNLSCNADKQMIVRDNIRYGDIRDIQLGLDVYKGKNNGFPALGSGSYIASTTFSVWPSWQQTLGGALGSGLFVDPINRFLGCSTHRCDDNGSGAIDTGENTNCTIGDPFACSNNPGRCLPLDPDQQTTCWDEVGKQFFCPSGMFVYAYRAANNAREYELFTNFEYSGNGTWAIRPNLPLQPNLFTLPFTSLATPAVACQRLDFTTTQSTAVASIVATVDCSLLGGDVDQDGVCDNDDNCSVCANVRDCYNPDQRDSNGDGLGDACDVTCTGDSDNDGVCDQADNCRTVFNPIIDLSGKQYDYDKDGIGDACDPCTDVDGDGWWDIDTGANDARICPKDNCTSTQAVTFLASDHYGYCKDGSGNAIANKPCRLPTGNYSCSGDSCAVGTCSTVCGAGGYGDFRSYNPLQEDYDNDLVGYICDACIDFDSDGFGDYPFYTKSSNPASAADLTAVQQQHFWGCQLNPGSFQNFSSRIINTDMDGDGDFDNEDITQCTTVSSTVCSSEADPNNDGVLDVNDLQFCNDNNWPDVECDIDGSNAADAVDIQLLINCTFGPLCDVNGDGYVDTTDINTLTGCPLGVLTCNIARGSLSISDLDNCPAGPFGAVCHDRFGIEVSCANPAEIRTWTDIHGDTQPIGTQRDYNLNGIGDVCDAQVSECGDGLVDGSRGEVCDCGDTAVSTDSAANGFVCTSLNNRRCNGAYDTTLKCDNDNDGFIGAGETTTCTAGDANACGSRPQRCIADSSCTYCAVNCTDKQLSPSGYCGDEAIQWKALPNGGNEKCDDGPGGLCLDNCTNVDLTQLANQCIGATGSFVFPVDSTFNGDEMITVTGPQCSVLLTGQLSLDMHVTGSLPTIEVVFVSDTSGSMDDTVPGGSQRKIDALRDALTTAVNQLYDSPLGDSIKIGFVRFSTDASDTVADKGGCPNGGGSLCRKADQNWLISTVVNSYTNPDGGTHISSGVDTGYALLGSTPQNRIMIVMSDGAPDSGRNTCEQFIPSDCHRGDQTCVDTCLCGLLRDKYDWNCSGIPDADPAKIDGVKIYSASFGTETNQVAEMNGISSNAAGVACGTEGGFCYAQNELEAMYTTIVGQIINTVGYSFNLIVDGQTTNFTLPFRPDGQYNNLALTLPSNFCGGSGTHTFRTTNAAGLTVNLSGFEYLYCAPCDADGDGILSLFCGGADCDDANNQIPTVTECPVVLDSNPTIAGVSTDDQTVLNDTVGTSTDFGFGAILKTIRIALSSLLGPITGDISDTAEQGIVAGSHTGWVEAFCVAPGTVASGNYFCDSDTDGDRSSTASGTCGTGATSFPTCIPGSCSASAGTDCNDDDGSIAGTKTEICGNGIDEDCSGAYATCTPTTENCSNGIDDNGNGFVDCADFDCQGQPGPGGAVCCWTGTADDSLCGTCQRCVPGSAFPNPPSYPVIVNDYRCSPFDSDEGVNCTDVCTYCSSGSCVARLSGDGNECTVGQTCQAGVCAAPGQTTYYVDADGDGSYGTTDATCVTGSAGCPPAGSSPSPPVAGQVDCNDSNGNINPGETDVNCNNIDENCSGGADEGYINNSVATNCGVGACASTGFMNCVNHVLTNTCTAGTPTAEICDGTIDNDCNGVVDNGCSGQCTAGQTSSCSARGFLGVCGAQTATCTPSGSWDTSACSNAAGSESAACTDNLDNDCDDSVDCQDTINCPAGNICQGNCLASATCNQASFDWVCTSQANTFCGSGANACGVCTDTNASPSVFAYNCSANAGACSGGADYCGSCQQSSSTNFNCEPNVALCNVGEQCNSSLQCISCSDVDGDGLCDGPTSAENVDPCPYDPNNDQIDGGDGVCAIGCTSGPRRYGFKDNGYICSSSSFMQVDPCMGSSCNSGNSCLVAFGALDYFNIYINGKLVIGNLFVPATAGSAITYGSVDTSAGVLTVAGNPPGSVINNVLFNVGEYLTSGQNVIAFETSDQTWVNGRQLRGAFANITGTGLCGVIDKYGNGSTVRKSTSYNSGTEMPVKCYAINDGGLPVPSAGWKLVGFTEDANWKPVVAGNSGAGGPIESLFRPEFGNPLPVWGQGTYTATGKIYCRYVITK